MNESLPENDEQLVLKKRARRRLIGAIVFVSFAAVVLPMVMDQEPPSATPSIELRIPTQEKGFVPPSTGVAKTPTGVAEPIPATEPRTPEAMASVAKTEVALPAGKTGAEISPDPKVEPQPVAKPDPKPEVRPASAASAAKGAEAKSPKPAKAEAAKLPVEAKRAQSILDGKAAEAAAGADGPHVILIGAFANPANVQTLQKKLGEIGLRVYTEPLESPQGKKTRVRVGPFQNRDAAEKAAARMKSIGVGGVVAPKA